MRDYDTTVARIAGNLMSGMDLRAFAIVDEVKRVGVERALEEKK